MANVFSVSTKDELLSALSSATGGDTIELAGGDYGSLSLIDGTTDFSVDFDAAVTIRSADPETPASFAWMNLRGVSNLTFDSVVFDSIFTGAEVWTAPFKVHDSTGITIRNSLFEGELASDTGDASADGFATGIGLSVGSSDNITIENNEFATWYRGMTFGGSTNVEIVENDIHSIALDGMNFVTMQNVLIEDNYIHDFARGPSGHSDMIQFWTRGTSAPSTDIIIRGNTLDKGDGDLTQSIFMRNEEVDQGRAGPEMFYQNILIENNTIYNSHTHAIWVGETDGLTVQNNSVLKVGTTGTPVISLKSVSKDVIVEGNIAANIGGFANQSDWVYQNNAIIEPSDYVKHFITSSLEANSGVNGFIVIPDGVIEQLGAGSDPVQFSDAPDTLTPQFLVRSDEASNQVLIFDASLTVGEHGLISDNDAQFLWNFGDGSTAAGRIVQHEFGSPGYHDVRLTVVAGDGTTAEAQFTAGIAGDDLLQFDAQSGVFDALAFGEEAVANSSELPLQEGTDGYVLKLGGEGLQAWVGAGAFSSFFGTDEFEMSMALKADSAASWGEVARIHTSLDVSVDQAGNIRVNLFLDDGSQVSMASEGVAVNDRALHDITIRFDGEAGFT